MAGFQAQLSGWFWAQDDSLANTQVTDAGLKEIGKLKNLTNLGLDHNRVTDAGLRDLANLKDLTDLYLEGTKVTDAGVAALEKTLPKCRVYR